MLTDAVTRRFRTELVTTPDGVRYLLAGEGERVARPYHLRWLLPKVCGTSATNWRAVQHLALLGLLPAAWWYGGEGWRGLFVAAMAVGLAGVWRFNWRWPVLVDAPAMFLGLLCAACVQHGLWYVAIPLALLAGATKETAPVFAALWAWSPIPLVGLVPVVIRGLQTPGVEQQGFVKWVLEHPFAASRQTKKGLGYAYWVLPWGACLVGLAHLSWPLAATLAVAYAQTIVATDTVRLYVYSWPGLAVAASQAVDTRWLLPLAVLHLANPYRSEGA